MENGFVFFRMRHPNSYSLLFLFIFVLFLPLLHPSKQKLTRPIPRMSFRYNSFGYCSTIPSISSRTFGSFSPLRQTMDCHALSLRLS